MNVITIASRSAGSGKTTLTAHLASAAQGHGARCLVIDADPRGALTVYNARRTEGALPLSRAAFAIARQIRLAEVVGYDWAFIDTPATDGYVVEEAIRIATLVVIPTRPAFRELNAVRETVDAARACNKPYLAVFNGAPEGRKEHGRKDRRLEETEPSAVAEPRASLRRSDIPVWSGHISEGTGHAQSLEFLRLWSTIARSVAAINEAREARQADHDQGYANYGWAAAGW
jgi:chromosome partitioning protein